MEDYSETVTAAANYPCFLKLSMCLFSYKKYDRMRSPEARKIAVLLFPLLWSKAWQSCKTRNRGLWLKCNALKILLAHKLSFHHKIKLNKMHPTLSWQPKKHINNIHLPFNSIFSYLFVPGFNESFEYGNKTLNKYVCLFKHVEDASQLQPHQTFIIWAFNWISVISVFAKVAYLWQTSLTVLDHI